MVALGVRRDRVCPRSGNVTETMTVLMVRTRTGLAVVSTPIGGDWTVKNWSTLLCSNSLNLIS